MCKGVVRLAEQSTLNESSEIDGDLRGSPGPKHFNRPATEDTSGSAPYTAKIAQCIGCNWATPGICRFERTEDVKLKTATGQLWFPSPVERMGRKVDGHL